jgi:hypothetical protein
MNVSLSVGSLKKLVGNPLMANKEFWTLRLLIFIREVPLLLELLTKWIKFWNSAKMIEIFLSLKIYTSLYF